MKDTVVGETARDGGAPDDDSASSFGCAVPVTNRFALGMLLDEEVDPFDIIREAAQAAKLQQKKKKDDTKKAPANVAGAGAKPGGGVKKESQKDRRVPGSEGENSQQAQQQTKSLQQQGPRFPPRGGSNAGEQHGERRSVGFRDSRTGDSDASLGFSIERNVDQGDRGGRGRGGGGSGSRGRGAMRGGFRSTDGFDQRGKREFERHSGSDRTGVRPEDKRGGGGPRNWGSMKDQISAEAEGVPAEERVEGTDTAETGGNHAPEAEGEPAVEPVVEMSLDEWKALQKQNRPKAEFNIRKADTAVPTDTKVIHKSKKQEADEEEEAAALRRPANDITAQLRIDFGNLARPSRGTRGRGRGGRGGPPMRPESTSPQKPMEKPQFKAQAPNPDDPEDFPALA